MNIISMRESTIRFGFACATWIYDDCCKYMAVIVQGQDTDDSILNLCQNFTNPTIPTIRTIPQFQLETHVNSIED